MFRVAVRSTVRAAPRACSSSQVAIATSRAAASRAVATAALSHTRGATLASNSVLNRSHALQHGVFRQAVQRRSFTAEVDATDEDRANAVDPLDKLGTMTKEEAQAQLNQHFEETNLKGLKPPPDEMAVSAEVEDLVQRIMKLTLMDSIKFTKRLAEVGGLDYDKLMSMGGGGGAAAAAPAAPAPGATAAAAPAAEETKAAEQTEFKISLEGFDPNKKIALIKEIKTLTGLGLKQAKELVEKAPVELKDKATRDEADKFKEAIIAAGGDVKIS